jgi:hypothetical protein
MTCKGRMALMTYVRSVLQRKMPQMWAYAAWGQLVVFAEIQKIKFVWMRCYCGVTQQGIIGDE